LAIACVPEPGVRRQTSMSAAAIAGGRLASTWPQVSKLPVMMPASAARVSRRSGTLLLTGTPKPRL